MDDALDAMGNGRGVGGEEPGVEASYAARRGDRARDKEQPGRVWQEPSLGERLPRPLERRRRAVALAAKTEAGLLAGLADRGDRKRACARRRDLRASLQQVRFKCLRNR